MTRDLPVDIDLGGTWRFTPEGAAPATIEVPGFWEEQGYLDLDGRATYERDIEVPDADGFATFEFGAVADLCRVLLNDEVIGTHEVGFTPFALDASQALRAGGNSLRIEVDDPAARTVLHLNTIQGKQGWAGNVFPSPPSMYVTVGGIWQPCRLVLHGPVYITDLWCDMDPDEPRVGVELVNRGPDDATVDAVVGAFGQSARLAIDVQAGATAATTATLTGRDVERWSPEAPVLHEVRAEARVDGALSHRRSITTGLRRLEVRYDDVLINGRPYRMRAALHQGYWPRGLYRADADLIERDVRAARDAGLNTLRTHLKPFEPEWLDAADRAGVLLQCDLPIGEPVDPAAINGDSDYARRCLVSLREQVRRDRSRPSIVMWTLMNEMGLHYTHLLESDGYKAFVSALARELRALDPRRPFIENDWIRMPHQLVESHVRAPHWYGRAHRNFTRELDERLAKTSEEKSLMYVTEFGEWGLPRSERGRAFFDNEDDLRRLVDEAGWPLSYDEFADGTQMYQGWSNRIHAEQMRTWPHVKGFCLTQWTDVPHELNGLLSLRRNSKASIEMFRPALEDVTPIARLNRFSFDEGEDVEVRVLVSNWSVDDLDAAEVRVTFGDDSAVVPVAPVPAGMVSPPETCMLKAPPAGTHELRLSARSGRASYMLQTFAAPPPAAVEVRGSQEVGETLSRAGWSVTPDAPVVVVIDRLDAARAAALEAEARGGRVVVVLEQPDHLPLFDAPVEIPQSWGPLPHAWGPTPFFFTTRPIFGRTGGRVLAQEVYSCFPANYLAEEPGVVSVVIPPPATTWGAVVAHRRHGRGAVVACQLRMDEGLRQGRNLELSLLRDLIDLGSHR